MEFVPAITNGFQNYATFTGRAARSEYWYWVLFNVIVSAITAVIDYAAFPASDISPTNTIAALALLVPSLAVAARRLHDIDRTAWWMLIGLTIIGGFLLLYWAFVKGTDGPNQYGPDPLAGGAALARP
jgi:uncharacterized membrane protein YhaH (DUF805 family)